MADKRVGCVNIAIFDFYKITSTSSKTLTENTWQKDLRFKIRSFEGISWAFHRTDKYFLAYTIIQQLEIDWSVHSYTVHVIPSFLVLFINSFLNILRWSIPMRNNATINWTRM